MALKHSKTNAVTNLYQNEHENEENSSSGGEIKVHESVIATIVRRSISEIEGVARLAGSTILDNIAEIVGSKKLQDRAINVIMSADSVEIDVKIIAEYGVHLPTLAVAVQGAVITQVKELTGMPVAKVNVIIQGLDDAEKEQE